MFPVGLVESPLVRERREASVLDDRPQLGQLVVNQQNLKREELSCSLTGQAEQRINQDQNVPNYTVYSRQDINYLF